MALDISISVILLAATLRNIAGWIENSLQDGKIQSYEWGLLGATILRVGVLGLALYYGFNLGAVESGSLAVASDFILKRLERNKRKKR